MRWMRTKRKRRDRHRLHLCVLTEDGKWVTLCGCEVGEGWCKAVYPWTGVMCNECRVGLDWYLSFVDCEVGAKEQSGKKRR